MDFSNGGANLPKTAVEGFLGYSIAATITVSAREMAHAVNKAKPLVILNEKTEASITLQHLAQRIQEPAA
jgi:hypothetical protein